MSRLTLVATEVAAVPGAKPDGFFAVGTVSFELLQSLSKLPNTNQTMEKIIIETFTFCAERKSSISQLSGNLRVRQIQQSCSLSSILRHGNPVSRGGRGLCGSTKHCSTHLNRGYRQAGPFISRQ